MTDILNYENLVADHEERLSTKLRGCVSAIEFLEYWVPDADLVSSLVNMAEAAEMSGCESFRVRLNSETSKQLNEDELLNSMDGLCSIVRQDEAEGSCVLTIELS